jgi:hypothetical protein
MWLVVALLKDVVQIEVCQLCYHLFVEQLAPALGRKQQALDQKPLQTTPATLLQPLPGSLLHSCRWHPAAHSLKQTVPVSTAAGARHGDRKWTAHHKWADHHKWTDLQGLDTVIQHGDFNTVI